MPTQFNQRTLVTLKDPIKLPDGQELPHPVLIISSNSSNGYENHYTGVMMSATKHKDRFSFPCDNSMFESPLEKDNCQLRLYIIIGFNESDIAKFKNRMKPVHFTGLIEQVKNLVFCID
jgi:hypothetical protein